MSINHAHTFCKPVFKKNVVDDQFKFQPLPKPSGVFPYRLDFTKLETGLSGSKMVFHMVGDTGSAIQPEFQKVVASEMISQFNHGLAEHDQPQFLYHLGDVVYHFGEAEEYYRQFFEPYKDYPAPIFAIAGNHDSDINPDTKTPYKSLDAFTHVFCNEKSRHTDLARATGRKTMTQPNVYWTLETPLAIIFGLYSNVPKFGNITHEQKAWFISELKAAAVHRAGKVLIVCIHHAPYSADTNHGSSRPMIEFLEASYLEAGVKPDIVFSGHVHNYQRFSKKYEDGTIIPYIVAGAGGYATLFPIAAVNERGFTDESDLFNNVTLDEFCDDKHGFLRIAVEKNSAGLNLTGEYFTIPHNANTGSNLRADLFDRFTLTLKR